MREDHPIDRLIATVQATVTAPVADAMHASSQRLASRRRWVLGRPELFVEPAGREGRSLGLALSVYTARPPWGGDLDRTTDRAHLDEVKELLEELCRISGELQVSFAVDFAGEAIGWVEEGRMDESLAIGLIGEWQRVLDGREQ
ncbi:hypothetical protein [Catellatospora methionotrophica]|uniref:hypothetical protein n=1 Tax=Catellatospora methionotrophica TaxID=121620 RepID=UPI0033F0F513